MGEIGTDRDIFTEDAPDRVQTGGRPQVNRAKVIQLLKANVYTTSQIAKACGCSSKTINRIRNEPETIAQLESDDMKRKRTGNTIAADFDEECKRGGKNISFREWLGNNTEAASTIFGHCRRCWSDPKIWNKPSLVRLADRDDPLADQLAMKWLKVFGDDKKRIRARKKMIRQIFRFLGRRDINDKHLTMSRAKDPLPIRTIPEISMLSFSKKLVTCIDEMTALDPIWGTFIKTKLIFMARTGELKNKYGEHRGMFGIIKQGTKDSWLIMEENEDKTIDVRGQILDKGRITWGISYFPETMRKEVFKVYKTRELGEGLFDQTEKQDIRNAWKEVTQRIIGRGFYLHDLRKVSATWYYALRVPLEILCQINVGWKDMNTPKEHYLQLRGLLRKSDRIAYAETIPHWFKEEIGEYTDQ